MRREAALEEFVPAAVTPERSPFFMGEGIFPSKTVPRPGEPDAEPFFLYLQWSSREGRETEGVPREPRVHLQWAVRAYRELKSRRFERP